MKRLLPLLFLVACDPFGVPVDDTGDRDTNTDDTGTVDPNDPCGGVTYEGYCDGDVAVWCEEEAIQRYDCGNDGYGCGFTEDYGYWCVPDGGSTTNPGETNVDGMLTTTTYSATSSGSGTLAVPVTIGGSDESFLVTVSGANTGFFLWYLEAPNGSTILSSESSSDTSVTGSFYFQYGDQQFNWPSRPEDGPLTPGEYTVYFATTNSNGNYAARDVDVTVQVKADSSWSSGQVKVAIIYADNLANNATVVNGIESGVDRWREIWTPAGLQLFVTYLSASSVDADLASPGSGSSTYASLSNSTGDKKDADVVMVIGDDVGNGIAGIAGGIPGTIVSTTRAATVISWLGHTGQDGQFSSVEIDILGETMAHEVGHYMGLFHVVEFGYTDFDPLSDTSNSCSSQSSCRSALGGNLMYPEPVCTQSGCVDQGTMSTQQRGVKHRYTGTL